MLLSKWGYSSTSTAAHRRRPPLSKDRRGCAVRRPFVRDGANANRGKRSGNVHCVLPLCEGKTLKARPYDAISKRLFPMATIVCRGAVERRGGQRPNPSSPATVKKRK